jgi:HlyD family secretion protein
MKIKYIIGGLILVVIAMSIAFSFKSKNSSSYLVNVASAQKRSITEIITANGKIQPEKEVKISADVSGEIIELMVKEGDKVKIGDVLLRINPKIYLSQIERIEASLNSSKAQMMQSKAQLLEKENQYKRKEKLWKQKVVSDYEYEQEETNFKVAKANFEAAQYSVMSAEASLKEAQENLRKTTIYSPMTGTVSKLNVEKGERVVGTMQMTGTEIMRIADLNRMEVKVDVNENDIINVGLNDTAYIDVDAYLNRKFKGLVTEIANSANTTGAATDQVTNFEVKILILAESYADLLDTINHNKYPFRPGMSASVDIRTKTVSNQLTIPIEAVTTRADSLNPDVLNEVVFIYKDKKVIERKVKTGIQNNQYIVIRSGIDKEDEIVVSPYSVISKKLKDGAAVDLDNNSEKKK